MVPEYEDNGQLTFVCSVSFFSALNFYKLVSIHLAWYIIIPYVNIDPMQWGKPVHQPEMTCCYEDTHKHLEKIQWIHQVF